MSNHSPHSTRGGIASNLNSSSQLLDNTNQINENNNEQSTDPISNKKLSVETNLRADLKSLKSTSIPKKPTKVKSNKNPKNAKSRGPGRPPGSLNRTTIARMEAEQQAIELFRQSNPDMPTYSFNQPQNIENQIVVVNNNEYSNNSVNNYQGQMLVNRNISSVPYNIYDPTKNNNSVNTNITNMNSIAIGNNNNEQIDNNNNNINNRWSDYNGFDQSAEYHQNQPNYSIQNQLQFQQQSQPIKQQQFLSTTAYPQLLKTPSSSSVTQQHQTYYTSQQNQNYPSYIQQELMPTDQSHIAPSQYPPYIDFQRQNSFSTNQVQTNTYLPSNLTPRNSGLVGMTSQYFQMPKNLNSSNQSGQFYSHNRSNSTNNLNNHSYSRFPTRQSISYFSPAYPQQFAQSTTTVTKNSTKNEEGNSLNNSSKLENPDIIEKPNVENLISHNQNRNFNQRTENIEKKVKTDKNSNKTLNVNTNHTINNNINFNKVPIISPSIQRNPSYQTFPVPISYYQQPTQQIVVQSTTTQIPTQHQLNVYTPTATPLSSVPTSSVSDTFNQQQQPAIYPNDQTRNPQSTQPSISDSYHNSMLSRENYYSIGSGCPNYLPINNPPDDDNQNKDISGGISNTQTADTYTDQKGNKSWN